MTGNTPTSVYVIDKLGAEAQDWIVRVILYLPKILWGGLILLITLVLANYSAKSVRKFLNKTKIEKTIIQVIGLITYWLIFLTGLVMALNALGLNGIVASLVAGAGFTSIVLAFGTQDISKNVIAGFFIIASRQFRVGDNIIVFGGHEGIVRSITLRAIVLETSDGRVITVPSNVIFSNVVTNLTARGRRKVTIDFQINAGIDFPKISEELTEILLNEQTAFKRPKPEILLNQVTGKYYQISISYWTDSSPMMQRRSISEVNLSLSKYFEKKNLYTEWIKKV